MQVGLAVFCWRPPLLSLPTTLTSGMVPTKVRVSKLVDHLNPGQQPTLESVRPGLTLDKQLVAQAVAATATDPGSPWAPPGLWEQLLPTRVLTDAQRAHYFQHGYLHLEAFISGEWLARLHQTTDRFVRLSQKIIAGAAPAGFPGKEAKLEKFFVLEKGHSAEEPRLTRLTSPVDCDDVYWQFTTGPIADIAADLLGPNLKFHHSKLNFKWRDGGGEVKWHQDIQFWPHTNFAPMTIGVYLNDVSEEMGPMGVLPLSAYNDLHPLEDSDGAWTGVLPEQIVQTLPLDRVVSLTGRAGTVTVHNARCVHGSRPNLSPSTSRPLLLNTFTPACAEMLPDCGTNTLHLRSKRGNPIIRGHAVPTLVDARTINASKKPWAPNFAAGCELLSGTHDQFQLVSP